MPLFENCQRRRYKRVLKNFGEKFLSTYMSNNLLV